MATHGVINQETGHYESEKNFIFDLFYNQYTMF